MIRLVALLLLAFAATPAAAWYKGSATGTGGIYANACGTEPAGQTWCVDNNPASATYGFTKVTPPAGPYTGSCSAGTYSVTATGELAACGIYVSDIGTGTLSTCRVELTPSFDDTFFPDVAANPLLACPATATNYSGLRNNSPDMILPRRGDQFWDPDVAINPRTGGANTTTVYGIATSTGRAPNFNRNGLSALKPMVIMAVGPLSSGRAVIQSYWNCLDDAPNAGDNLMYLGIECGNAFRDPNSAYFPGIVISAATSAGGGSQYTLTAPLPAYMGTGTGWYIANLDNPNSPVGNTNRQILSMDGSRTVITVQSLCALCSVNTGDRLQITTSTPGGISHANASQPTFFYVEDSRFRFSGIGIQPDIQTRVVIRRSIIENGYIALGRAQGLFTGDTFSAASTMLFEENLADHNGWLQLDPDCTPGVVLPAKCGGLASLTAIENVYGSPANQSHGAYVHEMFGNATFQRNILTNNSGAGSQLRSGGTFYNNFVARNATGATGGGILVANNSTYNVFTQMSNGFNAILPTSAASASGNTLTFAHVPYFQAVVGARVWNASNPSSIPVNRTIASVTGTTITLNGSVTGVASGDLIYIGDVVQWGYQAQSSAGFATFTGSISGTTLTATAGGYVNGGFVNGMTITGSGVAANTKVVGRLTGTGKDGTYIVDQSQTVASTAMSVLPIGLGVTSNHQWNIYSDTVPAANGLGFYAGYGFSAAGNITRAAGSVVANNFGMNLPLFVEDNTVITAIDATGCGGAARITFNGTTGWQPGETATITGVTGMTGVNGTWTVTVFDTIRMCLVGSTPSGTWTGGGTVNGGVAWSNMKYSNVVSQATANSAALAAMSSFSPVGTPTVEYCDTQLGGGGYLADFIDRAREQRKGNWNLSATANAMNNCMRGQTDPTIALQ